MVVRGEKGKSWEGYVVWGTKAFYFKKTEKFLRVAICDPILFEQICFGRNPSYPLAVNECTKR